LTIGIAGTNQYDIFGNGFSFELFVNNHLLNVTELVSGIELIKKDPDFLFWQTFNNFGSLQNLAIKIGEFLFVNTGVNVENK
jgi:hypothetical protein